MNETEDDQERPRLLGAVGANKNVQQRCFRHSMDIETWIVLRIVTWPALD